MVEVQVEALRKLSKDQVLSSAVRTAGKCVGRLT